MGGFSTFLQHCQSKWNKCVPPQFQKYGTKKYLLVSNTFKKQPFSVPTKTTSYSNTKPSLVQSQTVIPVITKLSPQGTFLLPDTLQTHCVPHPTPECMPSRISCFSLSICPLSLNLCPPPLNAARPTPTTPRQVW